MKGFWNRRSRWGKGLIIAIVVIIALSIIGALVPASGDDDGGEATPTTTTTEETTIATETEEASETECGKPSRAFVRGISEGLTVAGGGSLSDAAYVEVPRDLQNSQGWPKWLVGADIDGSGLEGDGDIGVWATDVNNGPIWVVNQVAREFSEWGVAAQPGSPAREAQDAHFASETYDEALACVP
jgi:hypothetical protein